MFGIFRRPRKALLGSNSFGTYFLYAAGEVVLIILGILAALWIDGWNQDREAARQEQFYLQGLREEFRLNLGKLDTLIAVNRRTFDTTRELLGLLPDAETRQEEADLSHMLIEALSYEIAYNPNNSLLRELNNSGRFGILSDPRLRRLLNTWGPFVESVNRQEENLRNSRQQAADLLLGPQGSVLLLLQDVGQAAGYVGEGHAPREHSNLPLLRSLEFENRLLVFLITAESTETQHYLPLREAILSILERIESGIGDPAGG